MRDMVWAFFLKLGANMWGDEGGDNRYAPFFPRMITDARVWEEVVDFLPAQGFNTVLIDVGDGVQYDSHPEVSIPGAWDKDRVKQALDHMRSVGLTPIPKLNFSTAHDAWLKEYSRMVATPVYYRVCEDLIREVAELFGYPAYFHLGLDEEAPDNQKTFAFACARQKDLWWHDAYFFFDVCQKLGARPWIWADSCWHHPEEFFAKMPRSVLQSNWGYDPILRNPDGTVKQKHFLAYQALEEHGFDQVPTSSTCYTWYNSLETMELAKEVIAPERLVGLMTAAWHYTVPEAKYALLNDATRFGYAKRDVFPEYCGADTSDADRFSVAAVMGESDRAAQSQPR